MNMLHQFIDTQKDIAVFISKIFGQTMLIFASICIADIVAAQEGGDRTIKIAIPSWSAGKLIAYNIGARVRAITHREVSYFPLEGEPIWNELAAPNGKIDIFPDIWLPIQLDFWNRYVVQEKTVDSNSTPYSGDQGFFAFIPKALGVEQLRLSDLRSQKFIQMFSAKKDGVAEYWPGAAGWHSTVNNIATIEKNKLSTDWKTIDVDNDAFLSLLDARVRIGQPILFYCWTPETIYAKYNLIRVQDDIVAADCVKDGGQLQLTRVGCPYTPARVFVLFRKEFETIE
jgi:ABC-type proline/glycine betaine transport system substrate-binding protein